MTMTHALINFSLSPHLGATGVERQRDGMFREGKLYCVCYACKVSILLLHVMCVLMHVLMGINVSAILCILVWIHVHVCVALPIVMGVWGILW